MSELNVFSSGQKITAQEINENFSILQGGISVNAKIVGTVHGGGAPTSSNSSLSVTLPTTDYDFLTIRLRYPDIAKYTAPPNTNYGSYAIGSFVSNSDICTIIKPSSSYTFYLKIPSYDSGYTLKIYNNILIGNGENATGTLDNDTLTISNLYRIGVYY
jgi:hypothetical protein